MLCFRKYLQDRHDIEKLSISWDMKESEPLYQRLRDYGQEPVFREVLRGKGGKIKGNMHAELVFHAEIEVMQGNS